MLSSVGFFFKQKYCKNYRNKCKSENAKRSQDSVYVKQSYENIGHLLFYRVCWGRKAAGKGLISDSSRDQALRKQVNNSGLCRAAFIPWRKTLILETVLKSVEYANNAPRRAIFG